MEILFRNKRGTAKLCMAVSCNSVWHLNDREVNKITEVTTVNKGYTWEPVRDGFAHTEKLPLIMA